MKRIFNNKYIALLLFLFVLASVVSGCTESLVNKKESDLTEMELFGKVKSYRESQYYAENKFGKVEKGDRVLWSSTYHYIFNDKGFLEEKIQYEYVDMGPLASIASKVVYKYDESFNRIEEVEYDGDGGLRWKELCKYDNRGNLIERSKYMSDGSLDTKSVYKYDDKNNQIEFNRFNADGKLQFKNINKFDSKGNEVERSTYGLSGNISGRYTSSFDNEGNKIEYLSYNSNGNLKNKTTYEYDGNSKTIKSFNSDGTPEKKEVFKYDDKGNEIEYAVYEQRDHFEATYYSEYLFDEVGNWTKKTEIGAGEAQIIWEREIEYFD